MSRAALIYSTISLCLTPFGAAIAANVELPPERFDYPTVNVTVIHLSPRGVHKKCVELGAPAYVPGYGRIEGCSIMLDRLVVVPTPESVGWEKYACIWRHEIGHINGWLGDHAGGRKLPECW